MPYATMVPGSRDSSMLEIRQAQRIEPGPDEVSIRHTTIGVNFIDIYIRSGLYPWPVEQDLISDDVIKIRIEPLRPEKQQVVQY